MHLRHLGHWSAGWSNSWQGAKHAVKLCCSHFGGKVCWERFPVILQVGQSTQILLPTILLKWRGGKQWRSLTLPAALQGLLRFPCLCCFVSFSGLLSEVVPSALSCLSGVTALYRHVCLSLLKGGGEFHTLLCLHYLGPPLTEYLDCFV